MITTLERGNVGVQEPLYADGSTDFWSEYARRGVQDVEAFVNGRHEVYVGRAPVVEAHTLGGEERLREQSSKLIGRVALESSVSVTEQPHVNAGRTTLEQSIKRAAKGDMEARSMVRENVQTDFMERAYKSGHVIKTVIQKDDRGEYVQFGQTMEEMHANSLRHISNPILAKRARIEAHNGLRQQSFSDSGILRDYALVTFSAVSNEASVAAAKSAGFFTDSMSCAIQVVCDEDDGASATLDAAFVSGAEQGQQVQRFDIDAIVKVAERLGVDYTGLTSEEILGRQLLIRKDILQEGVLDLVKMYDDAVEAVTGRQVFFGNAHAGSNKDYAAQRQISEERAQNAQHSIEATTNRLIADSGSITGPRDATRRLHEQNDAALKQRIVTDHTIDSGVLGEKARVHVELARHYYQTGQYELLNQQYQLVEQTGESSSCPTGISKKLGESSVVGGTGIQVEQSESAIGAADDCEFKSKECPQCHKKDVLTVAKDGVFHGKCGCVSKKGVKNILVETVSTDKSRRSPVQENHKSSVSKNPIDVLLGKGESKPTSGNGTLFAQSD